MNITKMSPAFKDYLWGGTKLRDKYGFECDLDPIAEAWVLSCHKDGNSIAADGEYKGKTLAEIIEIEGARILGARAQRFEQFPLLIKLIDAKGNLSIQVHPTDEYALKHENEYGKTEMWYVVDCEEGSFLYYGFNREITAEEYKIRIENNTILEVLNKVEVKIGDCFFIEAGTVHAIGAGLLIAEIQQNSNSTYRVYDFGRVGADGKPRELHIEKAMAVSSLKPATAPVLHEDGSADTLLGTCDYFTVKKHRFESGIEIEVDDSSFCSLLCVDGSVSVENTALKAGESVFIPAGFGSVTVLGCGTVLESRV